MESILKMAANWGFPAFIAILFYVDFRKKIDGLDKLIRNDLFHIIEEDSKNTKDVKDAIKDLTLEIARMNGKK